MKQLMLDFVSVTEAAAIAAYPLIGRGDKMNADAVATKAMRMHLNQMSMKANVVIGEGEMDEAPMLYIGEELGLGEGIEIDIAVDPLDGTSMTAKGTRDAMTVIAASPKGTLLHAPDMYMQKLAVGREAAGEVHIDYPISKNLEIISRAKDKRIEDVTVAIQDRSRHSETIRELRELGAKVLLFGDGDICYSLATAIASDPIDLFLGTGGAPEGVISAVALKCLGGDFQAKLVPQTTQERARCEAMGLKNPETPLLLQDIVASSNCLFSATAVTNTHLIDGIKSDIQGALTTHSLLLNGETQKMQVVESCHPLV
ncbi:class II fructose-bisphosphatase [Shouchella tritolerans]|uniref:class II fructose-bisphosphatase n=1 Tax=Shouchella tritolerans TaxID=2979466 RepID=UPI0021E70289|nr:class II fructose-bisphosphatase [Shouchella tritolerans]